MTRKKSYLPPSQHSLECSHAVPQVPSRGLFYKKSHFPLNLCLAGFGGFNKLTQDSALEAWEAGAALPSPSQP